MARRYDEDVVLWSEEQAPALRGAAEAGWNAPIDWEHVTEEIESSGPLRTPRPWPAISAR